LQFEFPDDAITLHAYDPNEEPELVAHSTLANRLHQSLLGGAKNVTELAQELDAPRDTVRRTLNRQRNRFVRLDGMRWGVAR
jgi:hypothetical protein